MLRLPNTTNQPSKGPLDVLVTKESTGDEEVWVAQCLQYEVCTQARTLDELITRFQRVLAGSMILAIREGKASLSGLRIADSLG